MRNDRIKEGDWVVVTAPRSKYRGLAGEVLSYTESGLSVRVRLEGQPKARPLRVTSVTPQRREVKAVEEGLEELIAELTKLARTVRAQLDGRKG